jgi:hypothetical protein
VKKIVGIFVILFTAAFLPAVSANQNPSIVIVDTAIDTSANHLKSKIIHEVCIMESSRCPNNKAVMEGPGSASLPVSQLYKNGFNHGTLLSSVATQVNPNVNIVFIRIVPILASGKRGTYTDRTIEMALDWAYNNKSKFNITAVSISHGRHNLPKVDNYCPVRQTLKDNIIKLQSIGVASVFATGNDYDYFRVDFPACISEAVAVGSVEKSNRIALHSNGGKDLDFYALGDFATASGRAYGTSAAAAAFSAYWSKVYQGNHLMTYDYIKSLTKPVENAKVKSNLFINILG